MQIVSPNLESEVQYWATLSSKFDRDLRKLLDSWARFIITEARSRSPKVSGEMARSFYKEITGDGSEFIARIGNVADQFHFVEHGTGIFSEAEDSSRSPITARAGKRLKIPIGNFRSLRSAPATAQAFEVAPGRVRAGTAFVFRYSVKGQKPQRILQKVLEELQSKIDSDIYQLAEKYGFQ